MVLEMMVNNSEQPRTIKFAPHPAMPMLRISVRALRPEYLLAVAFHIRRWV
jgi:hypothetical protein